MKKLGKTKTPATLAPESELSAPEPSGPPQLLVGHGGQFYEFPSSSLSSALESGFRYPTPEELTERDNQAQWGNRPVLAGTLGALRGVTLGLSDVAYRGAENIGLLPSGTTEAMRQIKERNAPESTAGEVASFLVPGLGELKALGETGKVAKGLGAAQSAVGSVGSKVGETAAKIVGERLGGLVAPAAKFASEAAMFQTARNLSESALKDEELTAENITSHVGGSAALGAGLGLALPAFSAGLRMGANVLDKGVDAAVKQTAKFFDPDRSLRLYSGATGNSALLQDTIKGNKFRDAVEHLKDAGFYGEGTRLVDKTGKFVEVAKGGLPSSEQAYERLSQGMDDLIGMRKNVLSEADKFATVNTALKDKLAQFPESAERAIESKIDKLASNGIADNPEDLRQTLQWGKSLFEAKHGSLAGLEELKEGLYQRINKGYDTLGDAKIQILKDIARTVKASIETGVKVARNADPELAKSLGAVEDLNKTLASLSAIQAPMDKLIQKGEGNMNLFGMRWRDMLASVGGASVFGAPGAALGLASKALQTDKGLLWRAKLGEQIAAMSWASKINMQTQDKIAASLKSFVGNAGKQAELAAVGSLAKTTPSQRRDASQRWFSDTKNQIQTALQSRENMESLLMRQLNGFQIYAPGVADAMVNKQMQILGYLADRMPKDPTVSLNPMSSDWEPSDQEIYNFKQVVKSARNPLSTLEDFKAGTLTRQQVQTVADLYPKIYSQMVEQAGQMAMTNKLTYQKKVHLSTLLGVPLDNTMRPQFIQRMQSLNATPQDKTMKGSSRQANFAGRNQSASDATASRR